MGIHQENVGSIGIYGISGMGIFWATHVDFSTKPWWFRENWGFDLPKAVLSTEETSTKIYLPQFLGSVSPALWNPERWGKPWLMVVGCRLSEKTNTHMDNSINNDSLLQIRCPKIDWNTGLHAASPFKVVGIAPFRFFLEPLRRETTCFSTKNSWTCTTSFKMNPSTSQSHPRRLITPSWSATPTWSRSSTKQGFSEEFYGQGSTSQNNPNIFFH